MTSNTNNFVMLYNFVGIVIHKYKCLYAQIYKYYIYKNKNKNQYLIIILILIKTLLLNKTLCLCLCFSLLKENWLQTHSFHFTLSLLRSSPSIQPYSLHCHTSSSNLFLGFLWFSQFGSILLTLLCSILAAATLSIQGKTHYFWFSIWF
jgi:hypothetical protein